MSDKVTIYIVDDEACPGCNAIWGHEDESLDYPNRPKVTDEDGLSWWRCYNPDCNVGYYNPETGRKERKATPEEEAVMAEQIKEMMANIDFDKIEVKELTRDDVEIVDKRRDNDVLQ